MQLCAYGCRSLWRPERNIECPVQQGLSLNLELDRKPASPGDQGPDVPPCSHPQLSLWFLGFELPSLSYAAGALTHRATSQAPTCVKLTHPDNKICFCIVYTFSLGSIAKNTEEESPSFHVPWSLFPSCGQLSHLCVHLEDLSMAPASLHQLDPS